MIAYVILTGAVVFWPVVIIAMAMLKSPWRAFALGGSFTIGSMAGTFLSLLAADPLIGRQVGDARTYFVFAFAALGAIAGGLLAVTLLGKLSGQTLWRRP